MTGFTGQADAGAERESLTPEVLRELLLAAEQTVRVAGPAAQAADARRDGRGWVVTVDDGTGSSLRARTPNTDAAFDLLRSWAAGDGWWREAFGWADAGAGPAG